jgi:hypothetical protein
MMGKTRLCALLMPGLADRPSKYSNIYIDAIYVICDHFSSTCGIMDKVDVLSATRRGWSQETLDLHIASTTWPSE